MIYKFRVMGMSCTSCAKKIEKAITHLGGVTAVSVNNLTEELRIESDKVLNQDLVCQIIDDLGYQASDISDYSQIGVRKFREKIRLLLIVCLTLIIMYLSMGQMFGLNFFLLSNVLNGNLQLIVTTLVLILCRSYFKQGFKALKQAAPNMLSLVALGTSVTFCYSLFQLILVLVGLGNGHENFYFESVTVILCFVSLGKYFESLAKDKAKKTLESLYQEIETRACLVNGDTEKMVTVESLSSGDLVRIKPGEKVPVDGILVSGISLLDQSFLTGESLPLVKNSGDPIYAASINVSGNILVKVTAIGNETVYHHIVDMVEDAQMSQTKIERWADKVSAILVPSILSISVLTFLFWISIGQQNLIFALERMVSVLVIACPCALGLATPTVILIGSARASKEGIIYKNAEIIETLSQIDLIICDKTGTLTKGQPSLVTSNFNPDEQTKVAVKSLESLSEHPLSQAILSAYAKSDRVAVSDFESKVGFGIKGTVFGDHYCIGNEEFMQLEGISDVSIDAYQKAQIKTKTLVYLAKNQELLGYYALQDELKEDSQAAIKQLKDMGYPIFLASGDSVEVCQNLAKKIGISKVYAGLKPEDKLNLVQKLQEKGHYVAMLGDGINDAPALSQADFGISMGKGSDLSLQHSDLVLLHSNLSDFCLALRLSHKMLRVIKENLFWAFFYNIVAIPVAMGLLYFINGPVLNPMLASLAMSFSSVSVLLNALRLSRSKL